MNIGIAAPIEMISLKNHFSDLTEYDLSLGLGGTAVNIIIDGLVKLGHNVTVFTLDEKVEDKHILHGTRLKVIFGRFRKSSKIKTFDFCYLEFNQLRKFIEEEASNIAIINAHWSYEYAIAALLVAPDKTIVTFRDDAPSILKILRHPYRVTRLLMDCWVRRRVKNVIYNSPYLAQLIGLEGRIIGNPIFENNLTSARNYPSESKVFKICFIANGTDVRKNPHIVIDAFKLLRQRNKCLKLYFIGNGYGPNEEFADKYQSIDGVYFKGFQKHEKLMQSLHEFDLMLHTALEESFGNNLIEAMAKGIPVIAGNKSGAVPWVLNNGTAGVLIDITSAVDIADAVENLLTKPELYEYYSSSGFINVKDRFTQFSVCKFYLEAYKSILS